MSDRIHPLRVAVADDIGLFRNGLVLQLESGGIVVTDACDSAEELMPRLKANPPDIVCLDIRMPPTMTDEGIKAAERIREELPDIGILVLSMYAETTYAAAIMRIGATSIGYLIKDRVADIEALLDALDRINRGGYVIDPEVVEQLLERQLPRQQSLDRLTPREMSVLALMAEGHSNARIALELTVSARTVEDYIGTIFDKLDLPTDPDANRRVKAVITWLRGL